jgi:hypothetical protein
MTKSNLVFVPTPKPVDASIRSEEEIAFRAFLDENLAGQEEAKEAMVSILNAIRDPLRDPKKPFDSSLMIGPSTAGKTRAFKLLVRWIHGNEEKMMFFSGSEFEEKHQIQKLLGAPHGYLGYVDVHDPKYRAPQPGEVDDSAMLSQHNMDNSKLGCKEDIIFCLFDEWEKFHFAFNRFMLRPLREGNAVLNNGRPVSFRNVVICFTSNLAADELERMKTPMGFRRLETKVIASGEVRQTVTRELMKGYPPEFRNRIDRIVCFTELGDNELLKVVDIELLGFSDRVLALGEKAFILSVDTSAKLFLLNRDDKSAARAGDEKSAIPAMQQAMKSLLSEPLGRLVRRGVIHGGDRVEVTHKEGETTLTFNVSADPFTAAIQAAAKKPTGRRTRKAGRGAASKGAVTATVTGKPEAAVQAETPVKAKVDQADVATDEKALIAGQLQTQSVVVQDFVVVLRAADSLHPSLKESLYTFLGSSPLIKVLEDQNKYGDPAMHSGVVVAVNTTVVKVLAPIDAMFALKRAMPFLDINILAGPIEL